MVAKCDNYIAFSYISPTSDPFKVLIILLAYFHNRSFFVVREINYLVADKLSLLDPILLLPIPLALLASENLASSCFHNNDTTFFFFFFGFLTISRVVAIRLDMVNLKNWDIDTISCKSMLGTLNKVVCLGINLAQYCRM